MAHRRRTVQEALQRYDKSSASLRAKFPPAAENIADPAYVAARLRNMVTIDQYTRNFGDKEPGKNGWTEAERAEFKRLYRLRFDQLDTEHIDTLKRFTAHWGWFNISTFGAKADFNGWLLVQHADDDPKFQKKILARLGDLYPKGETRPAHYAYLYDRVAVAAADFNKAGQRYGTQYDLKADGTRELFPVEKPEQLDARRKKMGLAPIAQYLKGR